MPYDKELELRDGATTLSATETGSWVQIDRVGPGLEVVVAVPAATGTLAVKIETSEDGSTEHGDEIVFKDITAVGIYRLPLPDWTHEYIRYVATVTTGPFGATTINIGKDTKEHVRAGRG